MIGLPGRCRVFAAWNNRAISELASFRKQRICRSYIAPLPYNRLAPEPGPEQALVKVLSVHFFSASAATRSARYYARQALLNSE